METLGIASYHQERAARFAALNPALRARILGERPSYDNLAADHTFITVDCFTGERTIKRVTPADLPQPKKVRRKSVAKPKADHRHVESGFEPMPIDEVSLEMYDILDAVSTASGVPLDDMRGTGKRKSTVSAARQLFCYIAATQGLSYPNIAASIGMSDHASAMYSAKRFADSRYGFPLADWLSHEAVASMVVAADAKGFTRRRAQRSA